jgi:hypothetical protein
MMSTAMPNSAAVFAICWKNFELTLVAYASDALPSLSRVLTDTWPGPCSVQHPNSECHFLRTPQCTAHKTHMWTTSFLHEVTSIKVTQERALVVGPEEMTSMRASRSGNASRDMATCEPGAAAAAVRASSAMRRPACMAPPVHLGRSRCFRSPPTDLRTEESASASEAPSSQI